MPGDITLKTFPANETEALAFLYVQRQDLTGKTPEEIQTMYYEAYYALRKDHHQKHISGWLSEKTTEARQP